jgi:ankyrin repeat protein
MAAQGGNTEAVRLLLEAGAPVDTLDYRGRTPMDYVMAHGRHAYSRSRACLVELLRHGADPSKHLQSYRCRSAMKSARVSLW